MYVPVLHIDHYTTLTLIGGSPIYRALDGVSLFVDGEEQEALITLAGIFPFYKTGSPELREVLFCVDGQERPGTTHVLSVLRTLHKQNP